MHAGARAIAANHVRTCVCVCVCQYQTTRLSVKKWAAAVIPTTHTCTRHCVIFCRRPDHASQQLLYYTHNACQSLPICPGFSWQMPLCQHIPAYNDVKLVPSLTHILQACQGLDGVYLFLTQACLVMPARMETVKLWSCKLYAQRLQDNSPENKQDRKLHCKLSVF